MVDSVHVGLVTPRWAIGGSKNNGILGAQHSATNSPSVSISIFWLLRLVEMPKSTPPYPSARSFL